MGDGNPTFTDAEVDPAALEAVTEVSVSTGRKVQLEQFEPINEQVTMQVEFSDENTPEEKLAAIEAAEQAAWAAAERGLARRYEEQVREEAFGE